MKPAVKPIYIRFGDIHEIFFRVRRKIWSGTAWVDDGYQDLTGYTVLIQVRQNTESDVLLTYTITLGDQSDLTNGRGAVYAKVSGAQTAALPRFLSEGFYDIQITDTLGDPNTYIEGKVTFGKDVSRV
jgi:hypothetical protein